MGTPMGLLALLSADPNPRPFLEPLSPSAGVSPPGQGLHATPAPECPHSRSRWDFRPGCTHRFLPRGPYTAQESLDFTNEAWTSETKLSGKMSQFSLRCREKGQFTSPRWKNLENWAVGRSGEGAKPIWGRSNQQPHWLCRPASSDPLCFPSCKIPR